VTWNPLALSQCTGTMFTPVLHLRSLSKLQTKAEPPPPCQNESTVAVYVTVA